jgi:hypothetical protein
MSEDSATQQNTAIDPRNIPRICVRSWVSMVVILRLARLLLRWIFAPFVAEVGLSNTSVVSLLLPQLGEPGPNVARVTRCGPHSFAGLLKELSRAAQRVPHPRAVKSLDFASLGCSFTG